MKSICVEHKTYIAPKIELIEIDNEISIALNSTPPEGPEESFTYVNDNPFYHNISSIQYS